MTKVTTPKVQLVKSVHYCPATRETIERVHRTSTSDLTTSPGFYPTHDRDGNPLQTEFGLSEFNNLQTITLQEKPEQAPTGQLPRLIEVVLEGDLVDNCQPGSWVQVYIYLLSYMITDTTM